MSRRTEQAQVGASESAELISPQRMSRVTPQLRASAQNTTTPASNGTGLLRSHRKPRGPHRSPSAASNQVSTAPVVEQSPSQYSKRSASNNSTGYRQRHVQSRQVQQLQQQQQQQQHSIEDVDSMSATIEQAKHSAEQMYGVWRDRLVGWVSNIFTSSSSPSLSLSNNTTSATRTSPRHAQRHPLRSNSYTNELVDLTGDIDDLPLTTTTRKRRRNDADDVDSTDHTRDVDDGRNAMNNDIVQPRLAKRPRPASAAVNGMLASPESLPSRVSSSNASDGSVSRIQLLERKIAELEELVKERDVKIERLSQTSNATTTRAPTATLQQQLVPVAPPPPPFTMLNGTASNIPPAPPFPPFINGSVPIAPPPPPMMTMMATGVVPPAPPPPMPGAIPMLRPPPLPNGLLNGIKNAGIGTLKPASDANKPSQKSNQKQGAAVSQADIQGGLRRLRPVSTATASKSAPKSDDGSAVTSSSSIGIQQLAKLRSAKIPNTANTANTDKDQHANMMAEMLQKKLKPTAQWTPRKTHLITKEQRKSVASPKTSHKHRVRSPISRSRDSALFGSDNERDSRRESAPAIMFNVGRLQPKIPNSASRRRKQSVLSTDSNNNNISINSSNTNNSAVGQRMPRVNPDVKPIISHLK